MAFSPHDMWLGDLYPLAFEKLGKPELEHKAGITTTCRHERAQVLLQDSRSRITIS